MADRVLDGLLGLLMDDAATEVVYRPDSEPHPATRRLMATLGVRVEVGPVRAYSPQELVVSRDCTAYACDQDAEPGSDRCRRHSEENKMPTQTGWSRKKKTRQEILNAIKAFAAEHGRAPTHGEATGPTRTLAVSAATIQREFGSFPAGIRAAGLTPASDATTTHAKPSGSEPKRPAAPPAEAKLTASAHEPPAAATAVAPPDPPTVIGEAGSLPEQASDVSLKSLPVSSPQVEVANQEGHAFSILDLLTLIRDLDENRCAIFLDDEGDTPQPAPDTEALVRRLARAALSKANPADVGAAVLAQLDETT